MSLKSFFIIAVLFSCKIGFAKTDEIKHLQLLRSLAVDSFRYTDLLNKISLYYYERNADSVRYYAIKARDLARRLNYPQGKADAANNFGIYDEIRGNAQEALRYYLDAYDRYSFLDDKPDMVQSTMNIALVYNEIEKQDRSLVNFKKAFSLSTGITGDSIVAILYANYVNCFFNQLPDDSIHYYIRKAKAIATFYKDNSTILFADGLLAEQLLRKQRVTEAIDILESTLQSAINDSLFYSATSILIDLGNKVSDSATAANYYLQSLNIAKARGFRANLRYCYEQLYDFYQSKSDDSSSLAYSEKLLYFYYEQKKLDNNSSVDYVDYALMNKTLAASLLNLRYRQRMLWLTVAICLMLSILIIILWRNKTKMAKTAKTLQTQFSQNELSMDTLDKMNKNYARVIKVVAHDLRNPLSSITMVSEMMKPNEITVNEMEKLVRIVNTTSKSCFDLIEQLLHTDLDETFQLDKKEVSLDEILLQCVNLFSFKAKEKQQEIVLNNNLHIMFLADGDKLIRVISNLIANAIKFSPEGKPIHIQTFPAGNNLVITVTDKGIGIPTSMEKSVFDPFTPAKRKGTNGENTFGLGLYISKQIVEAHGGYIWFKSSQGGGTTFYVELPLQTNNNPASNFSVFKEKQEEG